MDFANYLKTRVNLIENHLNHLLAIPKAPYAALLEAAQYSTLANGKRIRPLLVLASSEMFSMDHQSVIQPACALELIHTYSMIHDDLPCMDNDDYRRGKLTLHKVYPEWHALLTGDFLLTYAFEVLAHSPGLSLQQFQHLSSILSRRAGADGMVGGQFLDLTYEEKSISLEQLKTMHQLKTGALLLAGLEFGGVLGGASAAEMDHLRQYGESIGLAFQIVDDILDVTASEKKHGKKVGSDVANNKTTYTTLLGIDRCREITHDLHKTALKSLQQIGRETWALEQIAHFIVHREI